MKDIIWNLLGLKEKKQIPVCAICGKKIEDPAFILVRGAIVFGDKAPQNPTIFTCPEQAWNYAQGFYCHTVCWIFELKIKGVSLYDMEKVAEAYNEKLKKLDKRR